MGSFTNKSSGWVKTSSLMISATGLLGAVGVSAQSADIDVSATVVAETLACSVEIDSVDFGNIEAGEVTSIGDYDQNLDMFFQCSNSVSGATATFDGGQNSTGSVRRLAGPGGSLIGYTINEPPSLVLTIGETMTFDLSSGSTQIPLVARVNAQTIPSQLGAYSDTITVTFTF